MFVLFQAAILQQTAEYIYQLEQEKTRLLSQNCQLKRLVNQHEGQHESTSAKKRKVDTTSE
jgi:transcription factor AP-4